MFQETEVKNNLFLNLLSNNENGNNSTNQFYGFSSQFPFIPFIGSHNSWRQDMSISLSTTVTFWGSFHQTFSCISGLDEKKQ